MSSGDTAAKNLAVFLQAPPTNDRTSVDVESAPALGEPSPPLAIISSARPLSTSAPSPSSIAGPLLAAPSNALPPPTPAAAGHASAASTEVLPPEGIWEEEEPKADSVRKPPRMAILAVAALLLVVLFIAASQHSHHGQPRDREHDPLPEDLIVDAHDLKNRREVTAEDFRSTQHVGHVQSDGNGGSPPPAELAAPALDDSASTDTAFSLNARQQQRNNDPEDLIAHRGRSPGDATSTSLAANSGNSSNSADPASGTTSKDESMGYRRPFVFFQTATSSAQSSASAPSSSSQAGGAHERPLAPAGSTQPAVLLSPISFRGGSVTVLAQADGDSPLPKGTRFIGSATADDAGRLSLRFGRAVLPDGTEARIEAEAQDSAGAFGLDGEVTNEGGRTGNAIAGEIAADTAGDVANAALNTLTGGLAGQIASDALNRATSRRYSSSSYGPQSRRITLAAGARFALFLHQAVVPNRN